MQVAYVSTYDASDIRHWSGLGYYIAKSLEQQHIMLRYIGPLHERLTWLLKAKQALYLLINKQHQRNREPLLLRSYTRQVGRSLKTIRADAVFSPGTLPISFLECDQPIVFWTDATFAGLVDFYPQFSRLSTESLRNGTRAEQSALSRCRLAIYSSEWAANTAIDNYQVDHDKVKVVPFGANVDNGYSLEDIKDVIRQRPTNKCTLLFAGVDWYRKGGDIALEIAENLNKQGLRVELAIVGLRPPAQTPAFVKVYDFVSKTTTKGIEQLFQLYATAHFCVLPSRADCTPVVFAEASAFGLPSITTNVGGIPTVIKNGLNGHTFSRDATVSDYCACISDLMLHREKYTELALSSFREYETRLNWLVAGKTVKDLMTDAM